MISPTTAVVPPAFRTLCLSPSKITMCIGSFDLLCASFDYLLELFASQPQSPSLCYCTYLIPSFIAFFSCFSLTHTLTLSWPHDLPSRSFIHSIICVSVSLPHSHRFPRSPLSARLHRRDSLSLYMPRHSIRFPSLHIATNTFVIHVVCRHTPVVVRSPAPPLTLQTTSIIHPTPPSYIHLPHRRTRISSPYLAVALPSLLEYTT